jgi:hypothetical protein
MTNALDHHPCFTRWADPQSDVVSYVLTEHAAPLQKVLYYITPSIAGPGHYLWFRGCFPPSQARVTGVVDLRPDAKRPIRLFPQSVSNGGPTSEATPLVTAAGDSAYGAIQEAVYLLGVDGSLREIGRLPKEILQNRYLYRLTTDITMSCDGKHLLLDCHIGDRWLIALMDAQTGEVKPLRWFALDHTHAAFSLHDPKLIQLNQGHGLDPKSGDRYEMDVRMWVMDTDLTRYEPVDPTLWFGRNSRCCHEWWTKSGKLQWCDYDRGIWEMDMTVAGPREKQLVWPRPLVHGQCDASERYIVGDQNPYNWNERLPCGVWFYDRQTKREAAIVTAMPPQPLPWRDFRAYHIDPHPHFSADGEWVIYTTTAFGKVTVALTPTSQLRERLA